MAITIEFWLHELTTTGQTPFLDIKDPALWRQRISSFTGLVPQEFTTDFLEAQAREIQKHRKSFGLHPLEISGLKVCSEDGTVFSIEVLFPLVEEYQKILRVSSIINTLIKKGDPQSFAQILTEVQHKYLDASDLEAGSYLTQKALDRLIGLNAVSVNEDQYGITFGKPEAS